MLDSTYFRNNSFGRLSWWSGTRAGSSVRTLFFTFILTTRPLPLRTLVFLIIFEAILNLANLLLQFLLKLPLLFKNQLLIAVINYFLVLIVDFWAGWLTHCNSLTSHLLLHLLLLDVLKRLIASLEVGSLRCCVDKVWETLDMLTGWVLQTWRLVVKNVRGFVFLIQFMITRDYLGLIRAKL